MTDDAKQARRTDPAVLRAHARGLFISNATMDDFLSWATPRQIDAADRLLATDVLLQCLLGGFGSVFPQCGLMVFPGVVIVSR